MEKQGFVLENYQNSNASENVNKFSYRKYSLYSAMQYAIKYICKNIFITHLYFLIYYIIYLIYFQYIRAS